MLFLVEGGSIPNKSKTSVHPPSSVFFTKYQQGLKYIFSQKMYMRGGTFSGRCGVSF